MSFGAVLDLVIKYKKPRYGNRETAKSWEAMLCESMVGAHGSTGKSPHLILLTLKDLTLFLWMVVEKAFLFWFLVLGWRRRVREAVRHGEWRESIWYSRTDKWSSAKKLSSILFLSYVTYVWYTGFVHCITGLQWLCSF